jgi:hypothetical protein
MKRILFACLLLGQLSQAQTAPTASLAQASRASSAPGSVSKFVQGFYNWYAPKAVQIGEGLPSDIALHQKASWFSPELSRKLRADWQAQSTAKQEVDALDFDPFLNSQDPDPYYRVGSVTSKGQGYSVAVHRVVDGKVEKQRAVTAEVAGKEGHWYFVNFRYPGGYNLLAVLAALQKSRSKMRP